MTSQDPLALGLLLLEVRAGADRREPAALSFSPLLQSCLPAGELAQDILSRGSFGDINTRLSPLQELAGTQTDRTCRGRKSWDAPSVSVTGRKGHLTWFCLQVPEVSPTTLPSTPQPWFLAPARPPPFP